MKQRKQRKAERLEIGGREYEVVELSDGNSVQLMEAPPNPFAHTRILRGSEIPPVCGRIPEGPGYHRWV